MVEYELLLGVIYGSPGAIITLFAVMVGGGYAYVFQTFVLARAAASDALRVVMGAVIISRSLPRDLCNRLSGL
jgi:hypothetical protein